MKWVKQASRVAAARKIILVEGRAAHLLFRFGHLFQRKLERRVAQGLTELIQRVPRRFTEFAGGGYGLAAMEGNLHLDADSANLATPVLQHNNKFRHKLA